MSDMHAGAGASYPGRHGIRSAAGYAVAGWLSLAAAPTFALMALLTVVPDGDPMGMFCSTAHGTSPLNGMGLMYGLMTVFHGGPWLKWLAERRRQRTCRPGAGG